MPWDLEKIMHMTYYTECLNELYHRNLDVAASEKSSTGTQTEAPADSHGHGGSGGASESLLDVTWHPDRNITVVKFNEKTIDSLRPGELGSSSKPVPFLKINSANPVWISPVHKIIDTALQQGRSMKEILIKGAKAADMVNEWIQKESIREGGMACERWHICLACGVPNRCTSLIPEPKLGWRRVCFGCLERGGD